MELGLTREEYCELYKWWNRQPEHAYNSPADALAAMQKAALEKSLDRVLDGIKQSNGKRPRKKATPAQVLRTFARELESELDTQWLADLKISPLDESEPPHKRKRRKKP